MCQLLVAGAASGISLTGLVNSWFPVAEVTVEIRLVVCLEYSLRGLTMVGVSVSESDLRSFEEFASKARRLRRPGRRRIPVGRFETFAARGLEAVAAPTREARRELADGLRTLGYWYTGRDLLSETGYKFQEDHLTRLVAWLLRPAVHLPSAGPRQFKWLDRLGVGIRDRRVVEPQLQVTTEDGIPDLVLDYPRDLVVIEAKVDSKEHPAPSGRPQTRAYVRAAKKRFDPDGAKRCRLVYLTKDRSPASNARAANTTFAEFALVQSEVLRRRRLDEDLRVSFRMVFSYLMMRATPEAASFSAAVANPDLWCEIVQDDLAFAGHRIEIEMMLRTLGIGG